jgi:hypothetical protein
MKKTSRDDRNNRKKTPQSSQSSENTTDDSAPPAKKDASLLVMLAPTQEPSSPSLKLQSPHSEGGHERIRRSSRSRDDDDDDDIESLVSVYPRAVAVPCMLPEPYHSPDYVMTKEDDTDETPSRKSLFTVAAEVADSVESIEDIEARVEPNFMSEAVEANAKVESSAGVPCRERCPILCVGLQWVCVAVLVGIVVVVGLFIILVVYFVVVDL